MLLYAMRRVQCSDCGVKVESVPWATGKHTLTKAYMLSLAHWARMKAMAQQFDLSETEVVHMALSRLAKEELPAYDADEGPLSARQLREVRKIADAALPKRRILTKQSLF
jgi:hypothetical protein